jgi:hypothetical protein
VPLSLSAKALTGGPQSVPRSHANGAHHDSAYVVTLGGQIWKIDNVFD